MSYFYISFASEERGFLGATVIQADDPKRALRKASRLGLNPGGEAAMICLPKAQEKDPESMAEVRRMLNRLCSKEEVLAHGGARMKDMPEEIQERFEEEAIFVCELCNLGIPHEH